MSAVLTAPAPAVSLTASASLRSASQVLMLGLALTLLQTAVVAALTGRSTVADAYRALYQWDSVWYARIAEQGYPDRVPERRQDMPTVSFFPGYPLAAHAVAVTTGLPTPIAVLVAAQFASWGFWVYLLLFLCRWQTPLPVAVGCVVAILVHPTAFYLVAGYSESLFLFGVLGFLYWQTTGTRTGWALAAAHGVLLTATRIVGFPLVVVPLAVAAVDWLRRDSRTESRPGLLSAAMLGGVAVLGGAAFFAYCQWHLGRWDVYMLAQEANWGIRPDYLAVLRPDTYRLAAPDFIDGVLNPNWVSRMCVPLTALLFLVFGLAEARAANFGGWRKRLALYLSAALIFYMAVSGLAGIKFVSMVRYTFCVHAVLVLAVAHLLSAPATVPTRRSLWAGPALAAAALLSILLQVQFIRMYADGQWVA
jgi:hypothetical protein